MRVPKNEADLKVAVWYVFSQSNNRDDRPNGSDPKELSRNRKDYLRQPLKCYGFVERSLQSGFSKGYERSDRKPGIFGRLCEIVAVPSSPPPRTTGIRWGGGRG